MRENLIWWSLWVRLLEAICFWTAVLLQRRRTKCILCCLLCALSSSYSPLALADPVFRELMMTLMSELGFGRGRICLIQVLIHESSLQTKQINACLLWTNSAHDVNTTQHIPFFRRDLNKASNHFRRICFHLLLSAEVKLIGLTLIAMEEDDGLGSWIIYRHYLGSLSQRYVTSLMSSFSFSTSVSRWNFFCCVILLYLQYFLPFRVLNYIDIIIHSGRNLLKKIFNLPKKAWQAC